MDNNNGLFVNGQPRFGHHGDSIDAIDLNHYQHLNAFYQPSHWLSRQLGFKQFQYFGFVSPELVGGCALAHLRHTAVAFVYLYQPQHGMLLEISKRAPLGLGVSLTNDLRQGQSLARLGDLHVQLCHQQQRKRLLINHPRCQADLWFDESEFEPLALCSRIGRNGWAYARKVAGTRCFGELQTGEQSFALADLDAFAHHDFTAGYLRRQTFWNWACLSGRSSTGDIIGLNLSCGVNETSFSENALWLNGQLLPLPQCQFDYHWHDPQQPWQIRSADGAINLRFTPKGSHRQRLNLLLAASDFKQLFGLFAGSITLADGRHIHIEQQWGFVEDQYAKW
ncbi:DUF2804 domain-containing protein [Ferrimonas senticii]|uniref:DUF2804 domain-containing protein n=1 Tax=Ferrimonas senticii TaxID=394566 RepID=UPI0003F73DB7|nr:DUF2804 domain-containing protein [Ferrimonas senticii]